MDESFSCPVLADLEIKIIVSVKLSQTHIDSQYYLKKHSQI